MKIKEIIEAESPREALDPARKQRLQDLIDMFMSATDPNDYTDEPAQFTADEVIAQIRAEFGDRIADTVESGATKMHFGREHHVLGRYDPLMRRTPLRVTKSGKVNRQDVAARKAEIKRGW